MLQFIQIKIVLIIHFAIMPSVIYAPSDSFYRTGVYKDMHRSVSCFIVLLKNLDCEYTRYEPVICIPGPLLISVDIVSLSFLTKK